MNNERLTPLCFFLRETDFDFDVANRGGKQRCQANRGVRSSH